MSGNSKTGAPGGSTGEPQTVRELLELMPGALNPAAAAGLALTYQFEINGSENFTAYLRIEDQQAVFHEGPAERPEVIIRAPAEVWLAVSRGELNGAQAFMTGKFKATGNLMLLMKLQSLFSK